ncbi:MAG TPA: DNA recombination protein RmuC [Devosiaceae bacterium]|jgi:DNA recombination protein RmuC
MNGVLMIVGEWPITYGTAALAGVGLALLLLAIALIVALRSASRRAESAAERAMEGLRANFIQQIAERDQRLHDLDMRNDALSEDNAAWRARTEGLQVRLAEQARQADENLKRFEAAREQMTQQFKAIAGDVLKSHSETFTRQNREQVDTLLKPLHDKITEFHTGLLKDRAAMGEQIRALAESNLQITQEAGNLTRALKSNAQTQGAWGEMILASILERSGLREGEQFITQTSHSGENGSRVRTDVEILMPNADRLVIDSKVSLTAFEAYINCDEDDERARFLQAHVISVRGHIKTLGEKEYQRFAGSRLDYVMMFVPIESALAVAVGADPKLIEYGIERGVMLTTPTTLLTVLRTVRNVWDIEKRHQNAEQIAERAGSLYDKVLGFLSSMDKLDENLNRARQSFDTAKGQLSTGSGNVVRQIEMLRNLGAKSNKPMPSGWDGGREEPAQLALDGVSREP